MSRPVLVGESNPYGGDPYYALYPSPDGCSGHRLCRLILGMSRRAYLDTFERVNLVDGKWNMRDARRKAADLITEYADGGRLILLGAKVCSAFDLRFEPFEVYDLCGIDVAVLPHPSGLCRLWNVAGAFARARAAVLAVAPELPLSGGQE